MLSEICRLNNQPFAFIRDWAPAGRQNPVCIAVAADTVQRKPLENNPNSAARIPNKPNYICCPCPSYRNGFTAKA